MNSSKKFHYNRPTATEVVMAKEDPLRPYCASNREDLDSEAYSTMVLRLNPDALLEVEKMSMPFLWFQWKLIATDSYIPEAMGHVKRGVLPTPANRPFHNPSIGEWLDFDNASEQKKRMNATLKRKSNL